MAVDADRRIRFALVGADGKRLFRSQAQAMLAATAQTPNPSARSQSTKSAKNSNGDDNDDDDNGSGGGGGGGAPHSLLVEGCLEDCKRIMRACRVCHYSYLVRSFRPPGERFVIVSGVVVVCVFTLCIVVHSPADPATDDVT